MSDTPIGQAIARARQRKRLTQEQLAEQLGCSANTVVNWETGKHFPRRHLGAIESALEIDLGGYMPAAEPVQ